MMEGARKRKLSSSSSEDEMPSFSKSSRISLDEINGSSASVDLSSYDKTSLTIMEKMGFRHGEGLGKHGQGRVNIVEASKQRGRRGLGLKVQSFQPTENIQWKPEDEIITVKEQFSWIPECQKDPPKMSDLRQLISEGTKKMNIEDETEFCDQSYIINVLAGKSTFDSMVPEEMRRARTRSNPFETIRSAIFQNRAAMKMANMDFLFDFMFTEPVDENGMSLIEDDELLYFADVCAGPGGFSEYVLWRKQWECKGFGFTLRGSNDFKLGEFHAGHAEMFEPFYGVDDSGNVFIPENEIAFKKFVMNSTDNKGVHFVMADGGFSVEGQENIQEILSKQLYLCQFMFALSVIRTGGHFVCKLFDLFTPFSLGLIYLMYRTFRKVCIVKPNTSRPANSERYIVCKWRRENTKDVHDYLYEVNCRLQSLSGSNDDVLEVVPLDILKADSEFCEYMIESNETLAKRQVVNLFKIKAFVEDKELYEKKQADMRKQCLEAWKIPDQMRAVQKLFNPMQAFKDLTNNENFSYMGSDMTKLTSDNLDTLASIRRYKCMVCGTNKDSDSSIALFIGLGRSNISMAIPSQKLRWNKIDFNFELPKKTVIYAEIVNEMQGEGSGQRKLKAIHIIDVLFICGIDIRGQNLDQRLAHARKLAKAVTKTGQGHNSPVRVKELYELKDLHLVFERLDLKCMKSRSWDKQLSYILSEERFIQPTGIYIFKFVKDPWMVQISRSTGKLYYFNTRTKNSLYEFPEDAGSDFKQCFQNRSFWSWDSGVQILDHQQAKPGLVHKETICKFIDKQLNSGM